MKDANQDKAPLVEELQRYSKEPLTALHTPGHKAGLGLESFWGEPGILARLDLTEISAFDWEDNLHQAEELAARWYGAQRSFFLVQGATQGILGAVLGAFYPGDTVLVARNCHISVIHALLLAKVDPIFIESEILSDWGIPAGVRMDSLEEALQEYPGCKGLIITNPSYQGIASQVSFYREWIGDRILIIDEAHGGYLGWAGLVGVEAAQVADAWVQGTHKMLGSLTQTGLLHLRGRRIDPFRVEQSLKLITTTSPSYILLASLDSNRRFLANGGARLFKDRVAGVQELKQKLARLPGVVVLAESCLGGDRVVDPWRICLSFRDCGLTGYEAQNLMVNEYRLQPEYADLGQVTCLCSPWQDSGDWERLFRAAAGISHSPGSKTVNGLQFPKGLPVAAMSPWKAANRPVRRMPFQKAAYQVAAEVIAPYPPGIPLLVPGELITEAALDFITKTLEQGGTVRGVAPNGEIQIVDPDDNG